MSEPRTSCARSPVLRVASHNVRGLLPAGDCSAKVGQLVHLWAITLQLDIVLLQETHLTLATEGRAHTQLLLAAQHHHVAPYSPLWASSPSGRAGAAVLVSERLVTSGAFEWVHSSLCTEGEGRLVGGRCTCGGAHFLPC